MVNSVQGPGLTPPTQAAPSGANAAQGTNKPAPGAPAGAGPQGLSKAAQAKAASASPASASDGAANTQDRFLKLLVTQMKNQDPLNPMDNAQVTSQMAQLSTVSGIDKVNSTLKALTDSMSAGQALSATGMIGHGALVPGSSLNLNNGKAVAGLDLAQDADSVKVSIKDGANNVVRTMQLGAQKSGVVPVAWDGLDDAGKEMATGAYKISAESVTGGGKPSPVNTLSFGMVEGIAPGSGGAKLDVGKLGMFNLADVKQVM
jgi:flagellar basal-body rod modification protein FlgD